MESLRKIQIAALILLGTCLVLTSCGTRTEREDSTSEDSAETTGTSGTVLSREQIIKIANRAARQYGWDLRKTKVVYDEGNAAWRRIAVPDAWPELEGRDFQAVSYWRVPAQPQGGLWILVDRSTGNVLSAEEAP